LDSGLFTRGAWGAATIVSLRAMRGCAPAHHQEQIA